MAIGLVLILLVVAVILLSIETISPDFIALGLLVVLVSAKILTVEEAFKGFGSEFIIMLAAVFVVGEALQQNGMVDLAAQRISRIQNFPTWALIGLITACSAGLSAFMNNTTVAAVLLTPVISIAKRVRISPSKLLMPMSFGALMGGTCTLIGTSTNIAGNAYLVKKGFASMTMFELLPIGLPLTIIGIVVMALGHRFIPARAAVAAESGFTERYEIRKYLSRMRVLTQSPLIGRSIFSLKLGQHEVRILKIERQGRDIFPDANTVIQDGDLLMIEGVQEDITALHKQGFELTSGSISDADLQSKSVRLVELLVEPTSELINRTLIEADFRKKYHITVLAIHRKNDNITDDIATVPLRTGDVLLGQGRVEDVALLQNSNDLIVLQEISDNTPFDMRKGLITLFLFFSAILLGSIEIGGKPILPLGISFLGAALLSIATGCITPENAYSSIDRRLLILIAGMTAFGIAMSNTGADKFLAQKVVEYLSPFGTLSVLAGFMILTIILTQPMSNAAAAMVVLPVAIETAKALAVNERTFAIAVIVSASVSMITPFEPCCILVSSAGQYKVRDFMKIGGILTLVFLIVMLILIPSIWSL
ncbi:MAG: SLC13 family permease [Saprospiraceae bacterium]|nr:SLC13 family permease [Saprospiraceae bacterium]